MTVPLLDIIAIGVGALIEKVFLYNVIIDPILTNAYNNIIEPVVDWLEDKVNDLGDWWDTLWW